jgi:hypothetical protein
MIGRKFARAAFPPWKTKATTVGRIFGLGVFTDGKRTAFPILSPPARPFRFPDWDREQPRRFSTFARIIA